jgi:hypothetical protein
MEYYPKNASQNYGDAVEGAKTAAFRRCAKELGVGLQAWKKDWCDGWWARKRSGARMPQDKKQGASTPPPAQNPQQPPAAAQANSQTQTKPYQKPLCADERTLAYLIRKFENEGQIPLADDYYHALDKPAVLFETEGLKDIPLEFVPVNKEQFALLQGKLKAFENGAPAEHAFPANPLPENEKKRRAAKKAASEPKPPPPPAVAAAKTKDPEWFFEVICPIPNKGQKRDEYMKKPDTIRSLYVACKAGDDGAGKRLWGFANHYEPTAREHNGKVYQPTEADKVFRTALDAFLEWEGKHGKDTRPDLAGPQADPEGEAAAANADADDEQAARQQELAKDDVPF